MSIVTVFGATGNQGGSVVSTILSTPELSSKYKVRAVTRDPNKEESKKLAEAGAEVVKAELNDYESVKEAVAGSYAVFGVTDFWKLLSKDAEFKQGKNIADASFAAGVKHLIWSSLPHATRLTQGKLPEIPHFDSKSEVEEYIEKNKASHGVAATHFMPGVFTTNLKFLINSGPDGVPTFSGPMHPDTCRIPWIDIQVDSGKFVAGILEAGPKATDGLQVHAVSEWLSPKETAEKISEAEGTQFKYAQIPRETFKKFFPEPTAEEMTQTMELIDEYHYYGVGEEEKQPEHDKLMLKGAQKSNIKTYTKNNGPLKK